MTSKSPTKHLGRYPFANKRKFATSNPCFSGTQMTHPLMVSALGRFPHWDRRKPIKGH